MKRPYNIKRIEASRFDYSIDMKGYPDALIVPTTKIRMWPNTPAGAIKNNGEYIRESGLERNWGRITCRPIPEKSKPIDNIDENVIFGGYIDHHYGHFLLESLSRFWAIKESNLRIVWASGRHLSEYQLEILEYLGVERARHLVVQRPTIFSRLWVPMPGYIIQKYFHKEQSNALAIRKYSPDGSKVYLSRSKFASKIANVNNELVMDRELKKAGWQIVHPQLLTFREQVDVFARASVIAGLEGSAMHTAIFCSGLEARIIMLRRKKLNENFDTIADALKLDQVNIENCLEETENKGKELEILDPLGCVQRILEHHS